MLELIVKYWVQWLLSLITGGLAFLCRKFYKLYIFEKEHNKAEEQEQISNQITELIRESTKESRAEDAKLQEQINTIKNGILSLQGRNFKQDCRELLHEGHIITLAEFENLQEEHSTYKSLGGNHDGDALFEMVSIKATNNIAD